ncbi:splicing factor 3B subunit 1-like [Dorcoceras hygrometricum]|uniref:Splicing factor 3B subunit 1-like n=1 Tax=Dorcoceras hygrometricum TaxID=472368 RepID=A0A2Z7BUE5_9LAMI|nr:splicing factor 3B subunit 1-like [Dorcoceras hygrometricum]
MAAMFKALESSGLRGFLGCSSGIYEADLVAFFHNALVRENSMVSTIQGKSVEITEEQFSGIFELPTEGLYDLSEVPKDLIFDARSIFSKSGEQVQTSCKKRKMKYEFRLLNDILAKNVTVKAGSFDVVTHERFLLMTAIHCGRKINRVLNVKTVGTYVAKQKGIDDGSEGDEPVMATAAVVKKKPVTKKRTAPTTAEPIAKKKRTTLGRAAPVDKNLALVTVAQDVEPISTFLAVTPHLEEPEIMRSDEIEIEHSIAVNDEDDNLDGAENETARKMASFTAPKQFLKEPLRSVEDDNMSGFKQQSKLIEIEKETDKEKEIEPVVTEELSLEEITDIEDTEPLSKALELTSKSSLSDEESMSIDDILKQIPEDMMLPSVTALREKILDEISSFFHSFSLRRLASLESVKDIVEQQDKVLTWAETVARGLDEQLISSDSSSSSVHTDPDSLSTSSSSASPLDFIADIPQLEQSPAVIIHISTPTADVTTPDFTESFSQLRASVNQIKFEQVQSRYDVDKLKDVLLLHISNLERRFTEILDQQDRVYRELDIIRKDVQDQKATLSNDLMEFRVRAQENFNTLTSQFSELVDYINRGGDAKKGEGSSSRGPQPPDDRSRPDSKDSSIGRGSRSEPARKRGGGGGSHRREGSGRDWKYWLNL